MSRPVICKRRHLIRSKQTAGSQHSIRCVVEIQRMLEDIQKPLHLFSIQLFR